MHVTSKLKLYSIKLETQTNFQKFITFYNKVVQSVNFFITCKLFMQTDLFKCVEKQIIFLIILIKNRSKLPQSFSFSFSISLFFFKLEQITGDT